MREVLKNIWEFVFGKKVQVGQTWMFCYRKNAFAHTEVTRYKILEIRERDARVFVTSYGGETYETVLSIDYIKSFFSFECEAGQVLSDWEV